MKLLLVDDDKFVRSALVRAFDMEGTFTEVREAVNGYDACRVLNEGFAPDAILSDFQMPECSGDKLWHKLGNAQDTSLLALQKRFVIMSGGDKAKLFCEGHHIPFVEKPATTEELLQALKKVLDR